MRTNEPHTNYIFVDFENVQKTDLDRIANKPIEVTLILEERHKSLPVKLVKLIRNKTICGLVADKIIVRVGIYSLDALSHG